MRAVKEDIVGAAALLASRAKAGGPGRTRTCNQTVMSGRIKVAIADSTAFSCAMDRVRRGLVASFLVRNWCGPGEIIALKRWIVATVRRAKVAAMPRRSQRSVLARCCSPPVEVSAAKADKRWNALLKGPASMTGSRDRKLRVEL